MWTKGDEFGGALQWRSSKVPKVNKPMISCSKEVKDETKDSWCRQNDAGNQCKTSEFSSLSLRYERQEILLQSDVILDLAPKVLKAEILNQRPWKPTQHLGLKTHLLLAQHLHLLAWFMAPFLAWNSLISGLKTSSFWSWFLAISGWKS